MEQGGNIKKVSENGVRSWGGAANPSSSTSGKGVKSTFDCHLEGDINTAFRKPR